MVAAGLIITFKIGLQVARGVSKRFVGDGCDDVV